MKPVTFATELASVVLTPFILWFALPPCAPAIVDFFREFTDEWMRGDPSRAAATRYFAGAEQAAFERQLTPQTIARFRAEMPGCATTRIFVIGQASEQPGGALRPFPLDRGPGVDRGLGQRELETPA